MSVDTTLRDILIVGAGPAGVSAALQLKGRDVLMLDVGFCPPAVPTEFTGELSQLRAENNDLFSHLIGEHFQSLSNLKAGAKGNLKLKAPYMDYIVRGVEELTPIVSDNFHGQISLSRGGLANAWGAGVFRFTDQELADFPFNYAELTPYYDTLTKHIGVSGENDDLQPWFLHDEGLQPPIKLGILAETILSRYHRHRQFFSQNRMYIGRSRLAVLTRELGGRTPYRYGNLEFFKPEISAIYTPAFSVEQLVANGHLDYRSGWLVESYIEKDNHVEVTARNIETNTLKLFFARRVLLAAGALNTSRIVLRSHNDHITQLPILDNPLTAFPLFNLGMLGTGPDSCNSSLSQLNFIFEGSPEVGLVQASFYGVNGPLRADVLMRLPLPVSLARDFFKHMSSCFGLAMCFYPGSWSPNNFVQLKEDNTLMVSFAQAACGAVERKIMRLMRRIGYFSHPLLIFPSMMGSGLHYAASLPMRRNPKSAYECTSEGKLSDSNSVYVVDGACFSTLPAKNLTFTIMANSMRIANLVQDGLA